VDQTFCLADTYTSNRMHFL